MDQLVKQRQLGLESFELSSSHLIDMLREMLDETAVREARDEEVADAFVPASSGPCRMLVLEPSPHEINLCGILRDAKSFGLEVVRHHRVEEGLAQEVDVVLVDTTHLHRDNLACIRRIRKANPAVPIIALAALREDPVPYYRAGASDCLAIDFVTTQVLSCAIDRLYSS